MSSGKEKNFSEEITLEAIRGSGGIMSTIAQRLGCGWHVASRAVKKYESTKQAYLDEEETVLDMAESTILQSIKDKDQQSAKWYLSTKGRRRGYSTNVNISGEIEHKYKYDFVKLQQQAMAEIEEIEKKGKDD
jgi:hypothetical protein